jgi:uncharacterized protein
MTPGAVLLAPGAGSNRQQPSLVAIEAALAPVPVERMDFPYRKAGKKVPDKTPVLLDAVRCEAAALVERSGCSADRLVLGGRSMGGRMCSMAVADGLPAAALILICYPLHPPGKPENLRIAHLGSLRVPCLFIHGTRDPFATPDELREHTAAIPAAVTHVWVEGKGHDLKGADGLIASTIRDWLSGLPD